MCAAPQTPDSKKIPMTINGLFHSVKRDEAMKRMKPEIWPGGLKDGKSTFSTASGKLTITQHDFNDQLEGGGSANSEFGRARRMSSDRNAAKDIHLVWLQKFLNRTRKLSKTVRHS